jgi:hypothetical protein
MRILPDLWDDGPDPVCETSLSVRLNDKVVFNQAKSVSLQELLPRESLREWSNLMTTEKSPVAPEHASRKVITVSAWTFAAGLSGLLFADFLHSAFHDAWWVSIVGAVLQHASEIGASVGLIGLLLELCVRREYTGEIIGRLQALFRMDRSVANTLSPETRKNILETTLCAQLGDVLGRAAFNGLIRRILTDESAHRRDAHYHITLREMTTDIVLNSPNGSTTLRASDYFEITAEYRFIRKFSITKHKTVACIFGDGWDKLMREFKVSECVLRESLPLRSEDQRRLVDTLKSNPQELNKFCSVNITLTDISVDHDSPSEPLKMKPPSIQEHSIVFELDVCEIPEDKEIMHSIIIEGLIDKNARSFPILIVEPTCLPEFEFTYPANLSVSPPLHILTTAKPFDPIITHLPGKYRLTLGSFKPEDGWVFPNSGVLFAWDPQACSVLKTKCIDRKSSDVDLVPDRA